MSLKGSVWFRNLDLGTKRQLYLNKRTFAFLNSMI